MPRHVSHSRRNEHQIGGTRASKVARMSERPTISIPDGDPPSDLVKVAEAWGADRAIVGADAEMHALAGSGVAVERVGAGRT